MKTKHAFIAAHASGHAIRFMCRVLGVAHSWSLTPGGVRPQRELNALPGDGRLRVTEGLLGEIFEQSKRCYGAPRIHA